MVTKITSDIIVAGSLQKRRSKQKMPVSNNDPLRILEYIDDLKFQLQGKSIRDLLILRDALDEVLVEKGY